MFGWHRISIATNRLVSAWQQVVKSSLAHWRLLSAVLIGVLLASTIMSSTVIYFDALRQIALTKALAQQLPTGLDISIRAQRGPTTREEYTKVREAANAEIDASVAWLLRDRSNGGRTPTFFLATPGNEDQAGNDNSRTYFVFLSGLEQQITVLPGGSSPRPRRLSPPGDPPELEAIVPVEAAERFGVKVDDRFAAVPTWLSDVPWVNVVVSGVFRRNEPQDQEFWYLEEGSLRSVTGAGFRIVPFFIPEQSFLEVLGPSLPKMQATYAWHLDTDTDRVDAWNARSTVASVEQMNRGLGSTLSGYGHVTVLDDVLREYDQRIFFSKLPMFVVLFLIAIVVLYYVATMSSMVVETRRNEVALLRSRGADSGQVLTAFALEGATIAVLAVLAAPLIAALGISALGFTPIFSEFTDGARLSVGVRGSAYALSALGGVLSFVALIIPAVQASRTGVMRQRQHSARPSSLPAFQRYYVDVLLLLVSIFLFRRLAEQGSVVATTHLGEATVNQLLLALPGLALVATAMVLLRLFPLAMSLTSKLLSSRLPAGPVMSLWQMSRDPTHYARLSLLLVLTAGLGIFASSFEATLDRSFKERVLYATGSDIRIGRVEAAPGQGGGPTELVAPSSGADLKLVTAFEAIPGVERASPVVRTRGRDLETTTGGSFEMLAADGERLSDVGWFREDFSDRPLRALLESLNVPDTPEGLALPPDVAAIGVRVKADRLHPTVRLSVRLRNARDQHANYVLGTLGATEWTVLETPLELPSQAGFQESRPLTLVALQLDEPGLQRRLLPGSILVDEIVIKTAGGESRVFEPFDDTSAWRVLRNTLDASSDGVAQSGDLLEGEPGSALFYWEAGEPLTPRGIFYGPQRSPLPVLASKAFVEATGHSVGEEFEVEVARSRMPVKLVGVFGLFPTMTDPDTKLLVADLTTLSRYTNLSATERQLFAIGLWISTTASGQEREELLQDLKTADGYEAVALRDRLDRLATSGVDPLVEVGWSALLLIAFSAVLVLSCLGFLIHAYVSFRNREFQHALLRTLGLSLKQLTTAVWLEQALVIAVGLALGTWMGGRLGATVMPFLGQRDFGGEVVPPFAMTVNWGTLILTYVAMVFVLGVITAGIIWFVRRISLQRILRLGEG